MRLAVIILIIIRFSLSVAISQNIQFVDEGYFEVDSSIAFFYRKIYPDSTLNSNILIKTYKMDHTIVSSGYFSNDDLKTINGEYHVYTYLGNLKYKMNYTDNKLDGQLIGYYNTGEIRRIEEYSNDKLIKSNCFTKDGHDTIYYPRLLIPTFKNGYYQDFRYFIANRLIYPPGAANKGISGEVYVYFCINSKSEVCDIKILKSPDKSLSNEALRLVKKSSKYWQAGYIEGKKAKISFIFPITFQLK